jgi:hypothetical protein
MFGSNRAEVIGGCKAMYNEIHRFQFLLYVTRLFPGKWYGRGIKYANITTTCSQNFSQKV